jgi:5-methylthioadenosine/S-adenosylhomocysteine deaminase
MDEPDGARELLIEGAALLPSADAAWLESAAVLIRDGVVATVGDVEELARRHPGAERAGGPGCLVIPGLVNAHQHAEGVSTAQMGFADEPFEPWMVLMHSLPTVEPYLTTLFKSMLMLTSGVTTHVHSHFPAKGGYEEGSGAYLAELEGSVEAHRVAGLRTAFAPYWRDRARWSYDDDDRFLDTLPDGLAGEVRSLGGGRISNEIYIDAIRELSRRLSGDPLIGIQLSIAAPQWASDDLLDAVAAAAAELELPIHMHALESLRQREWGDAVHGGRELWHLAERGVLGERTTIAHGVYLRDSDIDLLAEHRAMVAHNCSSNLRLACGIAPVRRLVARGITVGIGSDDMAIADDEDMFSEVRMAHVAQRIWEGPEPLLSTRDMLRLVWEGGARIAGLDGRVGRLEAGYSGDAVALDLTGLRGVYASPRLALEDLLVSRGRRAHVRDVVVGGRVVVRDGDPVHVDMDGLTAEVAEAAGAAEAARDPAWADLLERLRPWALKHPPSN